MARAVSRLNSNLVGDLLVEARRNARLTQSELGRRVGRPQNWISDVERGQAYCRFDDFVAIAIALGADPAALCRRYLELRALREGIARQPGVRWTG